MRFFCPRNVFSYKQRPAFSRRGFVSAWLDSASQAGWYEALWKNSLNDTTIMQSLACGPLDKSKQRWEKMFTGTRRRQWSSLWCSPRSGTRASRGEGSRTWRLRSPRPGNTMQSRSCSQSRQYFEDQHCITAVLMADLTDGDFYWYRRADCYDGWPLPCGVFWSKWLKIWRHSLRG